MQADGGTNVWDRKTLQPSHEPSLAHERMTIVGRLDAETFLPWILRHAAKLGLSHRISSADAHRVDLDVAGPIELIDMMEVGCSLGPIEVWVETIDRVPCDRAFLEA